MRTLPFHHAFRNLARTPGRTIGAALGAALVTGLATGAFGFARGMESSLRSSASPDNVIILGAGSEESIERSEIPASAAGIASSSIRGIRESAGTEHISPEVHVQLPVVPESRRKASEEADAGTLILCRGITSTAFIVHDGVRISDGRAPVAGRNEVAVGRNVASKLGVSADELRTGRSIDIDNATWQIVGILDGAGRVADGEIWVPLNDLRVLTQRESLSCVVLTLDPQQTSFKYVDAFTKRRVDLELVAMTETEYYRGIFEFFRPIRILLWITCVLIGLGAILGGIPIQAATFAARTAEVGTLQVVGFSRLAVVASFVQESVVVALFGATAGLLFGVFILDGWSIPLSVGAFGIQIDSGVTLWGVLFGILVGLVGAAVPTVLALRIPISRALRGN